MEPFAFGRIERAFSVQHEGEDTGSDGRACRDPENGQKPPAMHQ
jgi:hypothetical protein